MTEEDQDPCGSVMVLDGADILGDGNYRRKIPDVEFVCSLPLGHTPANRHSDGVTDWIGDEE